MLKYLFNGQISEHHYSKYYNIFLVVKYQRITIQNIKISFKWSNTSASLFKMLKCLLTITN